MGAARYVGRVGGLAVALGAGFAILSGQGVAGADPGETSSMQSSTSSPASSSTDSSDDASSSTSIVHRRADGEVDRDSDTEESNSESEPDADDTDGGDTDGDETADAGSHDSETEDADDEVDADNETEASDTEETDLFGLEDTSVHESRGFNLTPSTTVVQQDSMTSAVQSQPEPGPTSPPVGAAALTLLSAARPQVAFDSIGYTPDIGIVDGVITGLNESPEAGAPLTYTVLGKPQNGGKVVIDGDGNFSFLPYCTGADCTSTDSFRVLVAETSPLDALLEQNAAVKALVRPIIVVLHQIPIVRDVLAPVIGRSDIYTVVVPVSDFTGADPIAFTTTVTSFDGTRISVNYFPASGLETGDIAPTVLNGPSLATAGYIDPNQTVTVFGLVPGLQPLRAAGYNVVTWDPRGEFESSGILHLDSWQYEAQDVSAIITWVGQQPGTAFDAGSTTDPLIGMVGGSYGGGIQLTTAGIDDRVDAIAPGIAWNSLTEALYPNHAFKTSWASLLLLSLVSQGSRIDGQIYAGILTGVTLGVLFPAQQRWLDENSPYNVVQNISAPTLFMQGTVDSLFPLQQSLDNADALPGTTPVRMIWYCGGHGACLDLDDNQKAAQTAFLVDQTIDWLDAYLKDEPSSDLAKFTWVDQNGDWHTSNFLPNEEGFSTETIDAHGDGDPLVIAPILGGSGPQNAAGFPLSLVSGAEASNAVEVNVPGLPADATTPVYVVGSPHLTFHYSGVGTSRNVYAQLVDNETGRVVGNIVTPIEVTLDGTEQTADVAMENIAYTMQPGSKGVTLQIVGSATPFEDFTAYGVMNISDVTLTLPTADNVANITLTQPPPGEGYEPASSPSWEEVLLGRSLV